MGRLAGSVLTITGIVLWYYGGTSGSTGVVNLGLGAIVLGLVLAALPLGDRVDKEALLLAVEPSCAFLENLRRGLNLTGPPVVIPPYENLPSGGVFLPSTDDFRLPLGRLDGESVFVTGPEAESGLLVSPPPGWGILEYTVENVGELSGTGVGYASSAVSSVLSALGLGSAEAFEREDGTIEVFAKPLCDGSVHADPAVSAVLLGIAIGTGELLRIRSVERKNEHVKVTLERLGGIEKWL
ncbi:hypothetical protein [Thermococcus sp. MV11]|uniref:hypothetical protein n=1 Tax=Thermococcus sp. MV11 TaxID=1638267 RepID=UPI0014314343|nr:hypothetical protein [Thermococcus sp. MV11]NJE03862.1 hypothetical protein [Thermococcus sp. MV11]